MINEIRERLSRITPAPWRVGRGTQKDFRVGKDAVVSDLRVVVTRNVYDYNNPSGFDKQTFDDIDFIAHAPTDIAFLLGEVESKDKRIAELEAELRRYQQYKVGDTVYCINADKEICRMTVSVIAVHCKNESNSYIIVNSLSNTGKTVFSTREEAEKALEDKKC